MPVRRLIPVVAPMCCATSPPSLESLIQPVQPGEQTIRMHSDQEVDMFKSQFTRIAVLVVTGAILVAAFASSALAGGGHWSG